MNPARYGLKVIGLALLAFCSQLACATDAGEQKPLLTILYTAEAHGALLPCDCPLQPLGGIARRSTLIKQYRARGPVLLVDAGGWAAGSIYDEAADGDEKRNAVRTDLMLRAMRMMKYDVLLASQQDGNLIKPEYVGVAKSIRVTAGTRTLAIPVAHRETESNFLLWIKSPLPLDLTGATELPQIVLSRLGEDENSRMAAELNAEAIVINAGRKTTQRISWTAGKATVANFDYQAERLGVVEIFKAQEITANKFDIRVRLEPLTAEIPDDPDMQILLRPFMDRLKEKGRKRIEAEFWTMPECPGCIQATPELARLTEELGDRADISVHFVVHKEGGKLDSLHGEREMQEARVQAVIAKYYPETIWKWLLWREKNRGLSWESGAKELGILPARIRGALANGEDAKRLEADYDLMQRRHIDGTPSLVIANRNYDAPMERPHILRVFCALLQDPKPAICADVPACFFDAQCKKRGYIGRCIDAGKPSARCDASKPAVKVPAMVIVDRDDLYDNHERIMEVLLEDLPGIEFQTLDISEPAAKDLADKLKLQRLPAYILDPVAKTETGFSDSVGKAITENSDTKQLVLQTFAVGAHRLLNRPRMKGRVDLFVARLSKNGQEALETALDFQKSAGTSSPELALHDVLYWKEADNPREEKKELAAPGGVAEIEEAARAMAIRILAPDKLNAYLLERGKRRGSSYWDVPARAAGLDPEKVREMAEGPSPEILHKMYAEADLLKSFETGGEIILLAENCELIPIRSRQDLRNILEKVGPRK